MPVLLELKDLKKVYENDRVKTVAVDGISLKIKQGEFVAIMGPSGSGKSTLLHILGFLDRPTNGTYKFAGKSVKKFTDEDLARLRNREVGFVFQAFNLLARTEVVENVKLPLAYAGIPAEEQEELAEAAIAVVGLSERADHRPSQLSGGEQQRVAIARALINEPAVIFADEPTGNLDTKSGRVVMEIFERLHKEGHTVVLITHEPYIAKYAERTITLQDGKIKTDKTNHTHKK